MLYTTTPSCCNQNYSRRASLTKRSWTIDIKFQNYFMRYSDFTFLFRLISAIANKDDFMKSSTGVNRMSGREFSEQVQSMYQSLWRVSYSILRNGADCDDAVQEALFRAWARINTLKDMLWTNLYDTVGCGIYRRRRRNIIRKTWIISVGWWSSPMPMKWIQQPLSAL